MLRKMIRIMNKSKKEKAGVEKGIKNEKKNINKAKYEMVEKNNEINNSSAKINKIQRKEKAKLERLLEAPSQYK